MEYCIAGHHTGLMDGGTVADNSDSPTLNGILKEQTNIQAIVTTAHTPLK